MPAGDEPPSISATNATVSGRTLRRAGFEALPGWDRDALQEAWPAFLQSCRVLKKQAAWRDICLKAGKVDAQREGEVRAFFETALEPWQVVLTDGTETGLATGYYEPLLHGSRTRQGAYRTPLYGTPPDLVTVDLATVYPQLKGMRLRGRLEGKRLLPYPSRGEIRKSNCLAGQEIVWVDDAVDAFFLQVQGSGRVVIEETGEIIRLAYADQNGRPYRAIGGYLADKGEIKREAVSAQRIRQWLGDNPSRLDEVLDANPSYVFFREEKLADPGAGPKGALGVPLTPGRSVAVDPRHVPLGLPLFIDTTEPGSKTPLSRLVMAQDTGGAIRGAIRLDYFWGFGNEAGERAGNMKQPVRLWILQPKNKNGAAVLRGKGNARPASGKP
ncbi:MAG: murein transglycosylase A [Alistipes senegalensis]|nr:murein transglycosylase A [Oxalobacter formigenes]MCM1280640.1 murein transglycosylase A [Alistipes senegalensis]